MDQPSPTPALQRALAPFLADGGTPIPMEDMARRLASVTAERDRLRSEAMGLRPASRTDREDFNEAAFRVVRLATENRDSEARP